MSKTNKPLMFFIAPCLLDPNLRAKGLTPHPETKDKILKLAEKHNAKIEQLPCPEFLLLREREPKTYDEYMEIELFRELCKRLAEETARKLEKFKGHKVLIIGIARSPSCSNSYVYDKNNNLKEGKGLFIALLHEKFTPTPKALVWGYTEIDYRDVDGSIERLDRLIP